MARIYIDKVDIASRTAWFYILMTKAPVDIFEFNRENEEMLIDNPFKTVPLLVDGDVRVWGSQAVILYVAEKFNAYEGFGKTVAERSKIESIFYWATGSLFRSVAIDFVAPQLHEEEALHGEAKESQIEFAKRGTCEQLDTLESAYLEKTDFIVSSKPSFIDFHVGIILSVLDKVKFDLSKWPKTRIWYDKMKQKTDEMIKSFQEHEIQSSKQG